MTGAYNELYLDNARKVIAVMLDYVVNNLGLEGDAFFKMFATSGIAKQVEAGNPKYVAGCSGIELAHDVLDAVGLPMDPTSYQSIDRSPEYWLGWALAYYQWSRGVRFSTILQWLSVLDGTRMYQKYHELDIRHFCERVDELRGEQSLGANLK